MMNKAILFCGISIFVHSLYAQKGTNKPNVVIFFADDVSPGNVGFGGGKCPTPNLDKMAQSGAVFTNAYCNTSVCTPSRYNLITGKYAHQSKHEDFIKSFAQNEPYSIMWNTHLTGQDYTIFDMFNTAGYYTGFVGKNHVVGLENHIEQTLNIDKNEAYENAITQKKLQNYQKQVAALTQKLTRSQYAAAILKENYDEVPNSKAREHNLEWMTDAALNFINNAPKSKPFFLYMSTTAIHGPDFLPSLEYDITVTPEGTRNDLKNINGYVIVSRPDCSDLIYCPTITTWGLFGWIFNLAC